MHGISEEMFLEFVWCKKNIRTKLKAINNSRRTVRVPLSTKSSIGCIKHSRSWSWSRLQLEKLFCFSRALQSSCLHPYLDMGRDKCFNQSLTNQWLPKKYIFSQRLPSFDWYLWTYYSRDQLEGTHRQKTIFAPDKSLVTFLEKKLTS